MGMSPRKTPLTVEQAIEALSTPSVSNTGATARAKQIRAAAAALKKDTKARKKRFDAAHAKGMDALRSHDFVALDEAMAEERAIVDEGPLSSARTKGTPLKRKPRRTPPAGQGPITGR